MEIARTDNRIEEGRVADESAPEEPEELPAPPVEPDPEPVPVLDPDPGEPDGTVAVDGTEEGTEDGEPEDPPAALESSANPTEAGSDLKTEYTFFRKVSPTTQLGFPPPASMLDPLVRSKIPPTQRSDEELGLPKFISALLIGHALPP